MADAPRTSGAHHASAVFAGGCFWGVQSVFQHLRGVTATRAGFDGVVRDTADYETVSGGETGHAEAVEIEYDPTQISYDTLALDPTQINRQYPDISPQYRSALFTRNDDQAHEARAYIAQLDARHVFAQPIATVVQPDRGFYSAGQEHQNFAAQYPDNPYIAAYDAPRLLSLKALFKPDFVENPVLTLAKTD